MYFVLELLFWKYFVQLLHIVHKYGEVFFVSVCVCGFFVPMNILFIFSGSSLTRGVCTLIYIMYNKHWRRWGLGVSQYPPVYSVVYPLYADFLFVVFSCTSYTTHTSFRRTEWGRIKKIFQIDTPAYRCVCIHHIYSKLN